MRAGGGKQKGASYEREICVALSRWVSAGKSDELFWRSAMSGGRATVAHKTRGVKLTSHAGDITATHEDGHALTNAWYIECKRYAELDYASFMLKQQGKLAQFWNETVAQATLHEKMPMLIAREDRGQTTVLVARCMQQVMPNALGDLYMLSAATRIATIYSFQVQIHDFAKVVAEPFKARKLPQGARWLRPGEDPFAVAFVTDIERRRPQRQQRREPRRQQRVNYR